MIPSDQHNRPSHKHARGVTSIIRLTVQLNLLPNNSGLDIVVSIPLDLDRITLDSPSVNSTNELLSLVSRREVEPLLQSRDFDGGEGGRDGGSNQETEGGHGVGMVGKVLTSDDCRTPASRPYLVFFAQVVDPDRTDIATHARHPRSCPCSMCSRTP